MTKFNLLVLIFFIARSNLLRILSNDDSAEISKVKELRETFNKLEPVNQLIVILDLFE